ncbi:hypothetical protein C8R47DRAFT_1216992 [Mycena vitilis]|nr:hypothetical protein C8R47DRAFT_1216992 [Mycena vitilis]
MVKIPLEMVEAIIDHMKSDTAALRACGLLSRQWLPRTRYILFSAISFSIHGRHCGTPTGLSKLNQFLSVLESSLATFVPYVEEVKLIHHADELGLPQPGEILATLYARGIRPTRLFLDPSRHFFNLPLEGPPAFSSSLLHLQLEMNTNYIALDIIVDYICAFPLLETLKITGCPKGIIPTQPKSWTLPSRLHTLHTDHHLMTDWILSLHPIPRHITTICFTKFVSSPSHHWLEVNKYRLRSPAGEIIRCLTLGEYETPPYSDGPDFGNLQHLAHLTIHVSRKLSFEHLVVVLSQLKRSPACCTVQAIEIVLTHVPYVATQWSIVDADLADSEIYPQLRCLTVAAIDATPKFRGPPEHLGPIEVVLRRQLERCQVRGILRIVNTTIPAPVVQNPLTVTGLDFDRSCPEADVGLFLHRSMLVLNLIELENPAGSYKLGIFHRLGSRRSLLLSASTTSTKSSMLEVPGELVDSIIDVLKRNRSALITCSRLSRHWLPRSRYHLFSSVSFNIDWRDARGLRKAEEFILLLDSPLATIAPYVEEVNLAHRTEGPTALSNKILARLGGHGIRPRRVYLDCARHLRAGPLMIPAAFSLSLGHLELETTGNHAALNIIVDYICALPLLESVKITGAPRYTIDPTPPVSTALPPRLHTLHTNIPLITSWILSLEPIPKQITTLCFGELKSPTGHWHTVNEYLGSAAGGNIQALLLDITSDCPSLENLRRLEHLTIHVSSESNLELLVRIVSQLKRSPAAQTVQTIKIIFARVPFLVPQWETVDAELADPVKLPRLRCITLAALDATHACFVAAMTNLLRRQFPHCQSRGTLRVVTITAVSPAVQKSLVDARVGRHPKFAHHTGVEIRPVKKHRKT